MYTHRCTYEHIYIYIHVYIYIGIIYIYIYIHTCVYMYVGSSEKYQGITRVGFSTHQAYLSNETTAGGP